MRMQCFHVEYGVVVSKHDTALVTMMVGVAVAMLSVLSTQSDPVRNTRFSLINVTCIEYCGQGALVSPR